MTGASENELLLLLATLVGFTLYLIRAFKHRSRLSNSGQRKENRIGWSRLWWGSGDPNRRLANATAALAAVTAIIATGTLIVAVVGLLQFAEVRRSKAAEMG